MRRGAHPACRLEGGSQGPSWPGPLSSLVSHLPSRSAMIRLVNVHKSFGEKKVLQGFTLDVEDGETMVIIGYSGTGKSVAIKHIVGLLEPDQGTVIVDDLEVPKLSRRELYRLRARIGY